MYLENIRNKNFGDKNAGSERDKKKIRVIKGQQKERE